MQKILVVRFSALGDILMTLRALQRFSGKYEIHYLTKSKFTTLLKLCPFIHAIHEIPDHASLADLQATLKSINLSQRFDVVFDLHRNLRSLFVSLFFLRFGTGKVFRLKKPRFAEWMLFLFREKGFRGVFGRWIGTLDRVALFEYTLEQHSPAPKLRLLGGASALLVPAKPTVEINGDYLCICVESAWSQKQWKAAHFQTVADFCREKLGVKIVWLGLSPLNFSNPNDIDLTAKIDLLEVAAVLKNAKLLLCNDSGLMHLAEAVDTPVVAVFGPTTPFLGFAPHLQQSQVVSAPLWCRPCSKTGRACFRPFRPRLCLDLVQPAHVMTVISERIKK